MSDFTGKTVDEVEAATTLAADDGVLVAVGGHVKRMSKAAAVSLFSGLGVAARVVTDADVISGHVAILATDREVLFNVTTAVIADLPASSTVEDSAEIVLVDISGTADANTVTATPHASDTKGVANQATWAIIQQNGWMRLRPRPDNLGFFLKG